MSGGHTRRQLGPITRFAASPVVAGRMVMPDTANVGSGEEKGMVKHATANATTCLGVAKTSAKPRSTRPMVVIDPSWDRPELGIGYGPEEARVMYSAACPDGKQIVVTGDGMVGPAPVGATFDQIVGRCTQPGGAEANKLGYTRLGI